MSSASLSHWLLANYYHIIARSFERSLDEPERIQRQNLDHILRQLTKTEYGRRHGMTAINSYESFREAFSVTQYCDWQELIAQQRQSNLAVLSPDIMRYEPTSGSTHERKWIPYSSGFLRELNWAAGAWLGDVYKRYPGVKKGRHYWSISWVPEDLRGVMNSKDTQLFPWWQRRLLESMMLSHPAIQSAPNSESAWHATLLLLASGTDLSFISVWSPTYLLKVIADIFKHQEEIARCLQRGSWGSHQEELKNFLPPQRREFPQEKQVLPFIKKLWPQLALISCWDSSTSKIYAEELRQLVPHIPIQGKGLWATEGVVSIPWRGAWPLAVQSHFLEFRNLENEKIYPLWQLQKDWVVQPLLTTSSGFIRYALADRLRVSGFDHKTPIVEFLGRIGGTDLVGEKVDFLQAEEVLRRFGQLNYNHKSCLIACLDKIKPFYVLALKVPSLEGLESTSSFYGEQLEQILLEYHHYRVARELGQLAHAKVLFVSNEEHWNQLTHKSDVVGQNKPESLILRDAKTLGFQ